MKNSEIRGARFLVKSTQGTIQGDDWIVLDFNQELLPSLIQQLEICKIFGGDFSLYFEVEAEHPFVVDQHGNYQRKPSLLKETEIGLKVNEKGNIVMLHGLEDLETELSEDISLSVAQAIFDRKKKCL